MAHLTRCSVCGREFRCEGADHKQPAWYWCSFQCPDRTHHGFSLYFKLDSEFLQFCDVALAELEAAPPAKPGLSRQQRRRELRCRSRAQGRRQPPEVADGET